MPNKREGEHKVFSSLIRMQNRLPGGRKKPSKPPAISNDQGAERGPAPNIGNEDWKADQEELQRRWRYLAEAQRLSHSGTFGWKVSNDELTWSDETYRILGFTRETNPTIDLVFDRIHPEDRERLQQLRDDAAQNGMDLDVEHRILLPDGEIRHLHVVAHAGEDRSGNREYIGLVSDITERKRADEERQALSRKLEESNARLEEAQRVAHLGYWIWNLETNRVIFSNETCRIYGMKPQEDPIDLETIRELIHPEDRAYVFENAERAVRDGVHIETEHRLIRPSGEVRVVYSRGDLTRDASGRPFEMFGTCQDITERKQAEEERQALSRDLQESKAWLEEAQRVAHVGYWVWDLETNQVIWSEETYRIFGLMPQAGPFDVAKVGEMIHPEDREAVFRTAEEAIRSGTRADCEHRLFRPDGEMRIVHSLGDLKKDASGRPLQMFGTTQDITARKHAEQSLQRSQFYLSEGERLAHMGSWASRDLGVRWSDDLDIYWSDEVYKIFGLDAKNGPPQLQQFFAAFHPQDRASLTEAMKKMHEQHCGCDVTNRIVRPDGEIRYVRCVGVPVVENGVFRGFHGTTMDVTQHELLTQELRREQAYLAEGQRLTHTGSWASNLVTRQVFHSSEENNRLYGFDVGGYPNPFELHYSSILAEDEPALRAKLENAIRAGADFDVEYRIRRADGAIRFLRGIGHHDLAHEFGEYFGITMDITDQRRVEEEREALSNALQQSNARLEEAQRVAHIGHYEFNPIDNQVTWSAELCRIWGLSPVNGPLDLAVVFEMVHPEDREHAARAVEEIIRSGTHLKYEHRIVRPDGEVRFLQVLGTVKRDALGRAYELFGTCQDITDRKLAEQALQRSEVYLSEGQRLAHMGSWAFNATGFDYWSSELFEVHGLDPRGKPPTNEEYLNLVHPEDRDFVQTMIQTRMVDHSEFDFTKRIVRPDGKTRYVRCVGVPVTSEELSKGFVGTGIDVTEQELLTQELRREQAYLTDAQSMAHIGSWVYNLVTRKVLHSSDENARLYGFDPSEGPIPAERFFATQHAEDAPRVNAVLEKAVRDGTDFYLDEYRIRHTDGSIRFLRAIGHRNASGEPGEYVGVTMDITERKRAEQEREALSNALQQSNAYLAEAQSLAHIGSWATNFETGEMHHISDETVRLHGFDPKQGPIPLQRFYDTIHPEDEQEVVATLKNAIRTGTDYDIPEFRICLPDGTIRFLRTIGHRHPSGEVGDYIGVTLDITDRKRAGEERERLRQLEADLAHINRVNMMGELAAALAHEIKQPIAASITSANALLRWLAHDPPDLERARATAARIEQDGNRAAEVINSLQSFYRTGIPTKRQSVDLNEIIGEMTALLRAEAERNSVVIHQQLNAGMPTLFASRVQLQQVLMNLMLNAIEAMKDTGGAMTIKTQVDPNGLLVTSVSDTGVGLAAETIERIFDPFHTTKPQGTGMGLTITRSIVESYGGRVWAVANHGAGVTFSFTLPGEAEAHG
jgi:PAS domain S-box-containing protein